MNEIFVIICVILIFVYYVCIDNICYLVKQREGATKFAAIIYSIFFTPICGLLYLLLFPHKK